MIKEGPLATTHRVIELLEKELELLEAIRGQSTEQLTVTRGLIHDGLLLSGTFVPDASGTWSHSFQVPYRAVAFADPNKLGLTISSASGGESLGPGVIVTAAGDAACVPLVGTQIHVTPGASGPFFIAVYARNPGFFWG